MKDGSGCVVFFLAFRLGYSDFKVNKMEDRLEWYFDKSITDPLIPDDMPWMIRKSATMNLMKMDEGWVLLVVFLLMFRLNYSDFKVNKMEDRLEWYFDKSIWTP
jgi:hypothetical protein